MANLFMSGLLADIVNVSNLTARVSAGQSPEQKAAKIAALFAAVKPQLLEEIPDLPGKRILGKIQDLQRGFTVVSAKSGATKPLPLISQRRWNAAEKAENEAALAACSENSRAQMEAQQRAVRPPNFHTNSKDLLKLTLELLEEVPVDTLLAFLQFSPAGTASFVTRHYWKSATMVEICAHMGENLTIAPPKGSDFAEPCPIRVDPKILKEFWDFCEWAATPVVAADPKEEDPAAVAADPEEETPAAVAAGGKRGKRGKRDAA
jgi:hypothetical protein